jgi:hypothetical protein
MTTPKYSVILPHLTYINGEPNPCIDLCRESLYRAATMPFEIIDAVDYPDFYTAINENIANCKSDIIIPFNDDMFPAPGWDRALVKYCNPKTIVSTYMVESGRMPVHHTVIEFNAGRSPQDFNYDKFSKFVDEYKIQNNIPELEHKLGSGCPAAYHKESWIPYPVYHCADLDYFEKILPAAGFKFLKVDSFIYHIQSFTIPGGIKNTKKI